MIRSQLLAADLFAQGMAELGGYGLAALGENEVEGWRRPGWEWADAGGALWLAAALYGLRCAAGLTSASHAPPDPDLEPIVVRCDDQPCRPPQVFNFDEFADFPHLFRAFGGAFRRHHDAAQRITREGAFTGIRKFFAFLRGQRSAGRAIAEPADLTTELLRLELLELLDDLQCCDVRD